MGASLSDRLCVPRGQTERQEEADGLVHKTSWMELLGRHARQEILSEHAKVLVAESAFHSIPPPHLYPVSHP